MEYIFERKINYYETDRMGIVHHSNYIRFLEEARCTFMENFGLPYNVLEDAGIQIPVLSVKCDYKFHVTFGDIILINCKIKKFNGVRMIIEYTITDKKTSNLVLTAETSHCFTDNSLKPVNLKKNNRDFYEKICRIS